jgi:hypothetical protein
VGDPDGCVLGCIVGWLVGWSGVKSVVEKGRTGDGETGREGEDVGELGREGTGRRGG